MAYRRRYFDGQVTTPSIVEGAVTEEKIADNAVTSQKIKDEKIIANLKLVDAKFFDQYKKILENPVVDPTAFQGFGNIIEEIFSDTPEKRTIEALW